MRVVLEGTTARNAVVGPIVPEIPTKSMTAAAKAVVVVVIDGRRLE
jgi:hypothetical protein